MELKRLRYFRAVVEADGLIKAAQMLQITPGTLSKTVAQLETDVGHELFVRVGRKLELTDAGRRFYAASDRVMDEYTRLLHSLRSQAAVPSTLRIASFEPFTTHTLGPVIEELGDSSLRVLELGVEQIGEAVLREEADVGITYVPYPNRDLHFRSVARFEFGIFVRKGAFSRMPIEEVPFVAPVSVVHGSAVDLRGVDSWPDERVPRRVRFRVTSLESALELVRQGRCAIFLPAFLAGLHNATVRKDRQLRRLKNPPGMAPVRQTVYLVTLPSMHRDPVALRVGRAFEAAIERGVRGP